MTLQEQIKVMQHFADGGEIECEYAENIGTDNESWVSITYSNWEWGELTYRIKEEPKKMIKIAKYAYLNHDGTVWFDTEEFYKNDEDFKDVFKDKEKFKRLDYTEIEVEDY